MPDELTAEERAQKDVEELLALRTLSTSAGWARFFLSHLSAKRDEHLAALSSVALEPAKRSEHIHAYHLAGELGEWLPKRMKVLEENLRRYRRCP